MEFLQLVRARRRRWRVADVRPYGSCQLLTLRGAEPSCAGFTRHLLTPFDEVEIIRRRDRPRHVGRRAWRAACRALVAHEAPPGALRTAAQAAIDLLPHQLEPALAVLRGEGTRVLLADDVGLGKTIEAGLIVAELLGRGAIERILIAAPAGVRDQWIEELSARFRIDVELADARTLRRRAAMLPVGVNPWTTLSIAVASVDYIKRPEVLPAVRAARWDLVIVDEAHAAVGDSERHAALHALASRAAYVVLLTATPHNGDERAFASLCDLGRVHSHAAADAPLVVFRRTRRQIRGDAVRRVHTLQVMPTAAELHMYAALTRYRVAVREEHGDRALALSVLDKRAFSSAWSLAQSIERRLKTLMPAAGADREQLLLPLDDPDGDLASEDEPPPWPVNLELSDAAREERLLTAMLEAARAAIAAGESKLRALARLVRRVGEPIVIFTEYRDTALHVTSALDRPAGILHGSLSREQRTAALDRFSRRLDRLLVATDAAGQGLNLHRACRVVVNLELPWNPMRLEQRIGRVDRIGQRCAVHAFHLVSIGSGEVRVLSRLESRIDAARAAIDAPDPIRASRREVEDSAAATLGAEAAAEAARVIASRAFVTASNDLWLERLEASRPWIARARRRRLRGALGRRALLLYRVAVEDADGRVVESRLVPLLAPNGSANPASWPRVPDAIARDWIEGATAQARRFWTTRLDRERAIVDASNASDVALFQDALFDRRAERAHADRLASAAAAHGESASRLADAIRRSTIAPRQPELLLVVLP